MVKSLFYRIVFRSTGIRGYKIIKKSDRQLKNLPIREMADGSEKTTTRS